MAWAEVGEVNWKDIHIGARFGRGCDRVVVEKARQYARCKYDMDTKLYGFGKGDTCPCKYDSGKTFIYQPADRSKSGDVFTCIKEKRGFFHEVHQYKAIKDKFPGDKFLEEKEKAVGKDDIFLLFCTSKVEYEIETLENCAVVDRTCWTDYYGPFAGRAFFVSTVPPPDINECQASELEYVVGVAKGRKSFD